MKGQVITPKKELNKMEVSNLSDAVMTDKVTDKEGTKHLLHRPSVKES